MTAPRWPGRLFGPGLAPAGVAADVAVDGYEVRVHPRPDAATAATSAGPATATLRIPADALRLRRAGHDQRGVELSWRGADLSAGADIPADAMFACQVLEPADARALLAALPAAAGPEIRALGSVDQRQRLKQRVGLTALAVFLAFPVLLLLLFFLLLDDLAGYVVERIPVAQEERIARRYAAQFEQAPGMRREGPRHRVTRAILDRLVRENTRYDYTLFIADDPAINAFALPGGVVVVNDGLIEATATPEELAGVLAHEVQHVELRHGLRGLVRQAGLSLVVMAVTGEVGGTFAGDLGQRMLSLQFSREAETEADRTGFERLVAAGIDPRGMATFFDKLGEASGGTVELLSTHPASERRARRLRELLSAPEIRTADFPALSGAGEVIDTRDWPPPVTHAHR